MFKIGIDLGGTKIAAGIINENYAIIKKARVSTNLPRSATEIADDIVKISRQVCEESGIESGHIESVGIGSPGVVNKFGVVEFSSNLNFNNTSLREMVSQRLDKPVFIGNDANCAALGEQLAGCGNKSGNFVMVTLGTGIGGGIIMDNKLLRGINGACGEIGHMVIVKDGIECGCGRKGCFEKYASASALISQTKEALKKDTKKLSYIWKIINNDLNNVVGKTAFMACEVDDELANSVVRNYFDYLACGVTNLINIFQPEYLCVGGGIGAQGDALIRPLRERVLGEVYTRNSKTQTKICAATLGNDAGLIGAALLT